MGAKPKKEIDYQFISFKLPEKPENQIIHEV